jgi:hypothetical protein
MPVVDADEKESRGRGGAARSRAIPARQNPAHLARWPSTEADVNERAGD